MADRGLCWPPIMDFCQQHGWHYILRAQSQTRFVPNCSPNYAIQLGDLVTQEGQWWCGQGRAFAKAGWREVNVVACWLSETHLVSDLKPSLHLMRWYARRMNKASSMKKVMALVGSSRISKQRRRLIACFWC
jgi:hypothetical protein